MRLRNPFKRTEGGMTDPAPGGPQGEVVDYVRWYPPDTPFHWGQRFGSVQKVLWFTRWNDPHGYDRYFNPIGVSTYAHLFPGVAQSAYADRQLGGQNPFPTGNTSEVTALALQKHAQAVAQMPPASESVAAFGFNRT